MNGRHHHDLRWRGAARSTAQRASLVAVRGAARCVDAVRPPRPGVVVLAYHRIGGGSRSAVDLDPSAFDEQLSFLREQAAVTTLDAAVDRLAARTPSPETQVVVTFDDGSSDFIDVALPLLERYETPATLYLATAFVGGRFPWGAPAVSWAGLREAVSTGLVRIGSHTHNHVVMDKVPAATADDEARRSIDEIADQLGVTPQHFAYPKGVPGDPSVVAALTTHFRSIACADVGVNEWGHADVTRLRRSPIIRSDTHEWFARKAEGGLRFEGVARESLNRVRYRRRRV